MQLRSRWELLKRAIRGTSGEHVLKNEGCSLRNDQLEVRESFHEPMDFEA
jgi:hypothetical protein